MSEVLMVDCSHGNSDKDATRQIYVADVIMPILKTFPVRALMVESHLVAGRQDAHK
jgi:3-deoxy-7-phosphoheptulonate synthase